MLEIYTYKIWPFETLEEGDHFDCFNLDWVQNPPKNGGPNCTIIKKMRSFT